MTNMKLQTLVRRNKRKTITTLVCKLQKFFQRSNHVEISGDCRSTFRDFSRALLGRAHEVSLPLKRIFKRQILRPAISLVWYILKQLFTSV